MKLAPGASGTSWAVATPHDLATEAAAVAFEKGGNAIDAALAAAVTLAVVYPHMCGVGGDLFALVQHPAGDVVGLNASGRAAAGVDPEALRAEHGDVVPPYGPVPITVPGAVSGWRALHDLGGRLPWADAFGAAIAYAHDGAPVSRSLAKILGSDEARLASDPGLAQIFFPEGGALGATEQFRQPALGTTLQAIAAYGPGALYGGDVGVRYVAGLAAAGSPITIEDLRVHAADLVPPLIGRYRDLDVRVCPPNSQGFVLLEALAAIERMGLDPDPLGPGAGMLALAFRAAAQDRDHHLADPESMLLHPGTLLDDGHLAALCDEIRADAEGGPRNEPPGPSGTGDTVALVTADAEGFGVSLIQSLYHGFGAGILEPATGIVAHDRGTCFTLVAGHPNVMAPGKRPAHTLMPVMVHRDGRLAAVAGTMGGSAQPQINAVTLLRSFDLGLGPAEAVAAPRWLVGGMDPEGSLPSVVVEADVPGPAESALRAAGFGIGRVAARSEDVGHAHMIRMTPEGFEAGSDPRSDGAAHAG